MVGVDTARRGVALNCAMHAGRLTKTDRLADKAADPKIELEIFAETPLFFASPSARNAPVDEAQTKVAVLRSNAGMKADNGGPTM